MCACAFLAVLGSVELLSIMHSVFSMLCKALCLHLAQGVNRKVIEQRRWPANGYCLEDRSIAVACNPGSAAISIWYWNYVSS